MTDHELAGSRRDALALGAGVGLSAMAGAFTQANAAENAKASGDEFAKSPPATAVAGGPLVSGNYELAYQENFAQGLRMAGFSEEAIMSAMLEASPRLSLKLDGDSLLGGASLVGARKIDMGAKRTVTILGVTVDDYMTYFDRPDRMITTFTTPNKMRVWSVRRFNERGAINTTTFGDDAKFVSTRVWRRLPEQRGMENVTF